MAMEILLRVHLGIVRLPLTKVEINSERLATYDYQSLARIKGEWKIVSKPYHSKKNQVSLETYYKLGWAYL